MKMFRLLAAMVITVVMLFTVALAAEVVIDAPAYNGTDDTYTVTVKAAEGFEAMWFSAYGLKYPAAVSYTAGNASSSDTAAGFTTENCCVVYSADGANITYVKNDVILAVTFDVVDKTALVGSKFETCVDHTALMYGDGTGMYDAAASATVAAVAQDETVTGTATTDAKRELLLGGTYYTNLAVFDAEIPLVSTKNAKEIGWTLSAPEKADKVIKYTPQTAISGQGSIVFAAIVYNVPSEVTITATPYVVYGN